MSNSQNLAAAKFQEQKKPVIPTIIQEINNTLDLSRKTVSDIQQSCFRIHEEHPDQDTVSAVADDSDPRTLVDVLDQMRQKVYRLQDNLAWIEAHLRSTI